MISVVSLLTSSPLTKIGIICTQVLQEEKIFSMIPRSELSKFPATPLSYSMVKLSFSMMLSRKFLNWKQARPVEGQSLPQKITKGEKGNPKSLKTLATFSKFGFPRMPEQCRKTRRQWKERHAVMLQMPF